MTKREEIQGKMTELVPVYRELSAQVAREQSETRWSKSAAIEPTPAVKAFIKVLDDVTALRARYYDACTVELEEVFQ